MIHTDGKPTIANKGIKPGDAIKRLTLVQGSDVARYLDELEGDTYTEIHESAGELAGQPER